MDRVQRYFRIDRFVIENYRSIRHCDVRLDQLTFLVGPNGSGKSNFIDALSFVHDCLRHSQEKAAEARQGIHTLLHAPARFPHRMAFHLEISSPEGLSAAYSFEIRVDGDGSILVVKEECHVSAGDDRHYFAVVDGQVTGSAPIFPPASPDRLFLINAAGLPEFRPIYDFLSETEVIEPMPRTLHLMLDHYNRPLDGLTGRFQDLDRNHHARANLVQDYLRAIAEPLDHLEVIEADSRLLLTFVEKSDFGEGFNKLFLSQMSGGLLHSAEMLLALFKPPKNGKPAPVVAIEEPEAFLHPAAIQVIRDSFLAAKELRQILITSHSPDLLDDKSIPGEWIRVVHRDRTGTQVDPLDLATESIIRDQLFTPGELLRQGGLSVRSHPLASNSR